MRLSQQFASREISEENIRGRDKQAVQKRMLGLYGIGPASVEYLLFEYAYLLDELRVIPPWEQKILSRLLFNRPGAPAQEILRFFGKYPGYEKLAFHLLWEDLFWKHQKKNIPWLEKEIRM